MHSRTITSRLFCFFLFLSPASFCQKEIVYTGKAFLFTVVVDSVNESCWVDSIIIRKKDGKRLQVLVPEENAQGCKLSEKGWFAIDDMNFDGYNDVRLRQLLPAGPNESYYCWLYNPRRQKFERSVDLEDVTSPEVDQKKKRIYSSWRNGCCNHGSSTYAFINGKLVLMEVAEQTLVNDNTVFTVKKRIRGKLKLVEKAIEKATGY